MNKQQYIVGIHAASMALQKNASIAKALYVSEDRKDARVKQIIQLAEKANVVVQIAARDVLDKLVPGERHQGVVLSIVSRQWREADLPEFLAQLEGHALLLVLDQVQDPHNLGACLRTADASGVDAVIIPKDRSATITPVVRKVASGAAETVPVFQVTNLARTLDALKKHHGLWVVGLAGEVEETIYDMDFTGSVAIVMGNEGEGLRRLTKNHCDFLAKIPMCGSVSSLNVSVATGIVLYEVLRQRSVTSV